MYYNKQTISSLKYLLKLFKLLKKLHFYLFLHLSIAITKLNKFLKSKFIFHIIFIITFFLFDFLQQQLFDLNNISQVSNFDVLDRLFATKSNTSKSKNFRIDYIFSEIDNNDKKNSLLS